MATEPVGTVLQARMGSTRLPGKVLKPLAGVPMLERILARLSTCRGVERLILATSDHHRDDPIAETGSRLGIAVFRGSEADVLDRYYRCAQAFGLEAIVRATGDNPFVDVDELDRLILFRRAASLDYACAFPEFGSGLPIGVGAEIFTFAALERAWREARLPHHREHVNEYFYDHPAGFSQGVCQAPAHKHAPTLRLTVDTPEDFALAEALQMAYMRQHAGDPIVTTTWLVAEAEQTQ